MKKSYYNVKFKVRYTADCGQNRVLSQ